MKKVLIITYYWPPSGGSGVQRWLKCVRYLREFGWEPVVYTVSNGEYPVLDPGLEREVPAGVEVIRRPIWEPYQLYKRFTGQKKDQRVVSGFLMDKKPSLASRIANQARDALKVSGTIQQSAAISQAAKLARSSGGVVSLYTSLLQQAGATSVVFSVSGSASSLSYPGSLAANA